MFGKKQLVMDIKKYIPQAELVEFWTLYDDVKSTSKLSKYTLWKFIVGLFPGMDDTKEWHLNTEDILHPSIFTVKEE
jgi:hypothetical protein